ETNLAIAFVLTPLSHSGSARVSRPAERVGRRQATCPNHHFDDCLCFDTLSHSGSARVSRPAERVGRRSATCPNHHFDDCLCFDTLSHLPLPFSGLGGIFVIHFDCPHCGKTIRLKEELAGRRGSCPSCKQPIQAPAANTAPAYTDDDD